MMVSRRDLLLTTLPALTAMALPPAATISAATASPGVRECLRFQVERTRGLFDQGRPLPASLPFPLSLEIRLTWLAGRAILDHIAAQEYDTLRARPAIGTRDKVRLLLRAFFPI